MNMQEVQELLTVSSTLSYITIGILALLIGSLLNVIIYRLPIMLQEEWRNECSQFFKIPVKKPALPAVNLFFPRSFCQACKHKIPIYRNIPLLSFILQKGKCHHCQKPISYSYPIVELLCLVLSLIALWHFGMQLKLFYALIFIWIVLTLFFIDAKHQILPDSLTLGLLWIGLIANSSNLFTTLQDAVYSAMGGYLALWFCIKIYYLITGKMGMGNGDFKLFAAFGAWFGWALLPCLLLFASFSGATVGLIYLKLNHKTKETPIPFGPFLCVFGTIGLFIGNQFLLWYLTMI